MGLLCRPSANFIAPPCYVTLGPAGSVPPASGRYGHSPIDIIPDTISLQYVDPTNPPLPVTANLWVNGSDVGPVVAAGNSADFDDGSPILIPAVTAGNLTGASRFGFTVLPAGSSNPGSAQAPAHVLLAYTPANDVDRGKEIMGLGQQAGATSLFGSRSGYLSPPQFWGAMSQWLDGNTSLIFQTPAKGTNTGVVVNAVDYEVNSTGRLVNKADGVGSVTMGRHVTWDDFLIVLRGDPDGTYRAHLRVNQTTVKTLEVTAGTTRWWSYPGAIDIPAGSRVCWLSEIVSGSSGLDGEILWTSLAQSDDATLGGGESGGEY